MKLNLRLYLRAGPVAALAALTTMTLAATAQTPAESSGGTGGTVGTTAPGSAATGSGSGVGYPGYQSDTMAQANTGSSRSSGSSYVQDRDAYSLLPFTRRGYVGLNLGRPGFNLGCGLSTFGCDDPSVSGYLYTGGLYNEWLGLELGYFNSGSADRAGGSTRAEGVNLSGVLRAPLGAFNLFAKGGAMYGQTRVSTAALSGVPSGKARGWGASYGVGAGFDFTPNSGVVLEWSRHEFRFAGQGRQDVDTTSLGYVYRF